MNNIYIRGQHGQIVRIVTSVEVFKAAEKDYRLVANMREDFTTKSCTFDAIAVAEDEQIVKHLLDWVWAMMTDEWHHYECIDIEWSGILPKVSKNTRKRAKS